MKSLRQGRALTEVWTGFDPGPKRSFADFEEFGFEQRKNFVDFEEFGLELRRNCAGSEEFGQKGS